MSVSSCLRTTCIVLWLCALTERSWGEGSEVTHPVYKPNISTSDIEKIQRAYALVLALSEEALAALVPERSGFRYCGCPNCEVGSAETQLDWTIYAPHHVHCRFCGTRYPNEKFPERYQIELNTPDGKIHVYPYYKDAKGRQYFFSARAWFERRRYLAGAAFDLATLYCATQDTALARRAAIILARFAQVYPGYAVRYEVPLQPKQFFPANAKPPFHVEPYKAAKWSYWAFLDIPNNLLLAYDLLYTSGEFEKLDRVYGRSVKQMIEHDFFRPSVEFVLSYPEVGHNMSPHLYQGLIIAGRVLGEPTWAREGAARAKKLLTTRFYADGIWCEGAPTYQRQVLDLMSLIFKAAKGAPELALSNDDPDFKRAAATAERFLLPDGRLVPVNDSWARGQGLPLTRSQPILFPCFGYAILGHGQNEHQAQAHLNWSGSERQHLDKLGILLFAKQHELIPDIGNTRTKLSTWVRSTACHNTVMIDGKDQSEGGEGDLLLYDARNENVQIVEAQATNAYPQVATEYRRTLILVRVPPNDSYLVDIFRVHGGTQHDWLMHGSADEDVTTQCDLPLVHHEGSVGFITNLRRATVDQTWSVTFVPKGQGKAHLRTTMLGAPGTEVILGVAPSVRRAREDESVLDKYRMPVVIARHKAHQPEQTLGSMFVAVHEPFQIAPFISKIDSLDLGHDAILITISFLDTQDYVIYDKEASRQRSVRCGNHELQFQGRFATIRTKGTKTEWIYMVDSEYLRWDNCTLSSVGRIEGKVAGVYAPSAKIPAFFELTPPIPDDPSLRGAVMIVRHGNGSTHGFEIKDIMTLGDRTWLFPTQDHGFAHEVRSGKLQMRFFPHRMFNGPHTFRIPKTVYKQVQ